MKKSIFAAGDSISFLYCPFLEKMIGDEFLFHTKKGKEEALRNLNYPDGANCGDSAMLLAYLQDEDTTGNLKYDYFIFNCGLHDIKVYPGADLHQVEPLQYEENLKAIIALLQSRNIRIIWIDTTPAEDERHNSRMPEFKRFDKDIVAYNQVAKSIMTSYNIPIIDMYAFIKSLGNDVYSDHIHFVEQVSQLQAAYIYGFLKATIQEKDF